MHLELKWYFSWNQKFEKTKQIKKVREINRIYYLYLKWNRFTIVPLHQMMFQFFMDQFFGMIAIQSFVDTAWNCLFSWIIQWGLGVKFFSWKKNVYLLVRIHLCWKLQCYSWSFHAKDLDQRCQKQFVHCFSFYCK